MKAIDRLYEYLEYKGIKPTNFERKIELSNGYFSAMKKRNADMGEAVLKKITDYCREISPEWLLSGNGPMLRDGRPAEVPNPSAEPPDVGREVAIYKELLAEAKRDMVDLRAEHKRDIAAKDEEIKKLAGEIGAMGEKLSARTQTAPSAFLGTAHPGMPVLFDPAGPPDDGPLASDVTPATKPTRGQTVVRN